MVQVYSRWHACLLLGCGPKKLGIQNDDKAAGKHASDNSTTESGSFHLTCCCPNKLVQKTLDLRAHLVVDISANCPCSLMKHDPVPVVRRCLTKRILSIMQADLSPANAGTLHGH